MPEKKFRTCHAIAGRECAGRADKRMSALPLIADIGTQSCDVRFVPKADIERSIRTLCRHGRTNPAGPRRGKPWIRGATGWCGLGHLATDLGQRRPGPRFLA